MDVDQAAIASIALRPSALPFWLAGALHLLAAAALVWLAREWPLLGLGLLPVCASLCRDWVRLRRDPQPSQLTLRADALDVCRNGTPLRYRLGPQTWMTADWLVLDLRPAERAGTAGDSRLLLHRGQFEASDYAALRRWLRVARFSRRSAAA